jgi:hypothetical protein
MRVWQSCNVAVIPFLGLRIGKTHIPVNLASVVQLFIWHLQCRIPNFDMSFAMGSKCYAVRPLLWQLLWRHR